MYRELSVTLFFNWLFPLINRNFINILNGCFNEYIWLDIQLLFSLSICVAVGVFCFFLVITLG